MAIKTYRGKAATAYLESMLGVPNRLPDPDSVMKDAWDALGRELDAQLSADMQEVVDLWDVWGHIKENGGGITRPAVIVFPDDEATETKRFEYFDNGRTNANVRAAAAWVRKHGEGK